MTTITFDTRKAVRSLQAAGFSDAQADAMVDTLAEAFTDTVSTKADIADLNAEIGRWEGRLFRALWIQGAGIVALIVGLTKLL